MKRIRLLFFLIGIISATSCVCSDYICFPIQENGITLVLEVNNSNTQRIFLHNGTESNLDIDSIVKYSTQILVGKDVPSEIPISIISSPTEQAQVLYTSHESEDISIIPRRAFVLTDLLEPGYLKDSTCVTVSLPLKKKEMLNYWHQGDEVVSIATVTIKNKYSFMPEKRPPSEPLHTLPRFFTEQRREEDAHIDIAPLDGQQGFAYNGTEVNCTLPSGDWWGLSFFLDPSLPEFLFYEDHSFGLVSQGSFSVTGNNVAVVRTNMSLVCPGTGIRVSSLAVLIQPI